MRTLKCIATTMVGLSCLVSSSAQTRRAYLFGVGHANILDTYLSPEKYRGADMRFIAQSRHEKDSVAWIGSLAHEGNFAFLDNRSGNGGEMEGGYTFRYSLLHRWNTTLWSHELRLMAGGAAQLELGFLYNTRGSNNPAQARMGLQVGPAIAADYELATPHGHPLVLRYEAWSPLCGVMFSPNYGQSYYEIFSRGNYDHNVVPTTFLSTPSLRQMLTLDFRLIGTTWRIGYLGDLRQAKVNNLKYHSYIHSIVIGFVKGI